MPGLYFLLVRQNSTISETTMQRQGNYEIKDLWVCKVILFTLKVYE